MLRDGLILRRESASVYFYRDQLLRWRDPSWAARASHYDPGEAALT
jgi:hypothetical protein